MKRKVYFRADASADIGYGHFIRTLALADMLKDNFDCTFFTQSPTEYQRAEVAKVCKLVELPSDNSKFNLFLEYINGDEIVVLDNYFYSTDYQREIKIRGCRLVCIDDIHDKHYVADVVVNHAIEDSSKYSIEKYTKLCLGLDWALLRKPFLQTVDTSTKISGHWFISFGGSDYYNLTEKYIRIIHSRSDVKSISVVIGDAYRYEHTLINYDKVHIFRNLSSLEMAKLMKASEYAILPCSSICIEAISQGCKVYAGYYVDNQIDSYYYLSKEKLIQGLGNLNEIDTIELCDIKKIVSLTKFDTIPAQYSDVFNGLEKSFINKGLVFLDYVLLPEYEHKIIWENRNDDVIRINMDSSEIIPWENHCNFVSSLRSNTWRRYWAVYNDGMFIGSVNISYIDDNTVERGIFVVPNQIGKSWGTKIEQATLDLLRSMNIYTVNAKVLQTNRQSLYFHYKNGYSKVGSDEKYQYLARQL